MPYLRDQPIHRHVHTSQFSRENTNIILKATQTGQRLYGEVTKHFILCIRNMLSSFTHVCDEWQSFDAIRLWLDVVERSHQGDTTMLCVISAALWWHNKHQSHPADEATWDMHWDQMWSKSHFIYYMVSCYANLFMPINHLNSCRKYSVSYCKDFVHDCL